MPMEPAAVSWPKHGHAQVPMGRFYDARSKIECAVARRAEVSMGSSKGTGKVLVRRWDENSHKAVSAVDRDLLAHLYFRSSEAILPKRGDRCEPLQSERSRDFCDQCVTS